MDPQRNRQWVVGREATRVPKVAECRKSKPGQDLQLDPAEARLSKWGPFGSDSQTSQSKPAILADRRR